MVLDESSLQRNDALRELMRFARAIVEDGEVSESEAKGFQAWIEANPDIRSLRSVDEIVEALTNTFSDGRADPSDREALARLLERFGG